MNEEQKTEPQQTQLTIEQLITKAMMHCANTGNPTVLNFEVKDSLGVKKPISLIVANPSMTPNLTKTQTPKIIT